jgi:hypothetical protein
MSTQQPTIAYSASNRVVFSGEVEYTRQLAFFNNITSFCHGIQRLKFQKSSDRLR